MDEREGSLRPDGAFVVSPLLGGIGTSGDLADHELYACERLERSIPVEHGAIGLGHPGNAVFVRVPFVVRSSLSTGCVVRFAVLPAPS